MLALKILTKSVRLIFQNFPQALRISALPYLGFWLLSGGAGMVIAAYSDGTVPVMALIFLVLFAFVAGAVIFPWIAVAWHRFILREEAPHGVFPTWSGANIWSYFNKSLLLIVPAFVTMLLFVIVYLGVLGLFFGVQYPSDGGAGGVMLFLASSLSYYVVFRFSLVLPAAALGESAYFSQSWEETGRISGALALVVVIVNAVTGLENYAVGFLPNQAFVFAAGFVWSWFITMFSISMLTTTYGYLFEDRPLT